MVLTITSDVARKAVIERLRVDLVGPRDPEELLPARPSDIYLTGILWPRNTALSPDEDERLAVAGGGETTGEDTDDQARPAAATMRRPSTAGVSFAVRSSETQAPAVDIEVSFGVYLPEKLDDGRTSWRRQQVRHKMTVSRLGLELPSSRCPWRLSAGSRSTYKPRRFLAEQSPQSRSSMVLRPMNGDVRPASGLPFSRFRWR